MPPTQSNRSFALALLGVFCFALAWSAVHPYNYFTWFLEVVPALLALPILLLTYQRFPLTKLLYTLILIHAVILIVGGHYTYAREPLFSWIRDHFHLSRNYYDRVGHFAQGFVPALVAREVLIRNKVVKRGAWVFVLSLAICGAITSLYELFEWRVAIATGTKADDFLGTQGDPWDTQEDMATCFLGAVCALLLLSGYHDHQIHDLQKKAVMSEDNPGPAPHFEPETPAAPATELPKAERKIVILPVTTDAEIKTTRELFVEYGQSLGFSLCFQSFDQEYASLPGKYAPPRGRLLLAEVDGKPAGCVALRPLETGVCEMKRLYVRPEFRGLHLGRKLAETVIAEAKLIGYQAMRLDTVQDKMQSAVALYRALGFRDIAPYTVNPEASVIFMELELVPTPQLSLYGDAE